MLHQLILLKYIFWFSTAEFVCLIGEQRQQIEVAMPVRKLLFRDIKFIYSEKATNFAKAPPYF
jgi:hypothetical protein